MRITHPWNTVISLMFMLGGLASCSGPETDSREQGPASPEELAASEQRLATVVSCPIGSTVINYSPPLTNTPQDVSINGTTTESNCYTVLGEPVTSATRTFSNTMPDYSCLSLLDIGPSTMVLTWNTGDTSTLVLTRLATRVEGLALIATHTGTVRSGKFTGATVVRTATYLSTDLDACSSAEGLPRLTGTTTMTLLKLL